MDGTMMDGIRETQGMMVQGRGKPSEERVDAGAGSAHTVTVASMNWIRSSTSSREELLRAVDSLVCVGGFVDDLPVAVRASTSRIKFAVPPNPQTIGNELPPSRLSLKEMEFEWHKTTKGEIIWKRTA